MAKAKKPIPARWRTKMWNRVLEAQHGEIKKAHGEDAADHANYGWGDATSGERVDVATKVYLPTGARILSSTADYPGEEISHSWSEY